ncbi:hypothetical protein GCM10020000_87370 [Streptomyces olivoverticillatus]
MGRRVPGPWPVPTPPPTVTVEREPQTQGPKDPGERVHLEKQLAQDPGTQDVPDITSGMGARLVQVLETTDPVGPADARPVEAADTAAPGPAPEPRSQVGAPAPKEPPVRVQDELVTLRQAMENHLPHLTIEALRMARKKDPDFPWHVEKQGQQMMYRASDLLKWERNRVKSTSGTRWEDDIDFS